MIRSLTLASLTFATLAVFSFALAPLGADAQVATGGFESMSQPDEEPAECKAPKPPKDLAETAYIRNGYRAILRIMAAERWQETGSCDCFLTTIPWEDVVDHSEVFITSDNPRLPFDVVELDERATELEDTRAFACEH